MNQHHEEHHDQAQQEPDTARVLRLPSERIDTPNSATAGQADESRETEAPEDERAAESTEPDSGESTVIEGEVIESPQVDQPEAKSEPGSSLTRSEKRLPILPAWAKDPQEFQATARWALGYAAHTSGYHAVRCPVYLARILARVPQGTLRLIQAVARWIGDAEGRPVRHASARREDAAEYLKLSQQRDGRVRARAALAAGLGAASITAIVLGYELLPSLAHWVSVAAVIGGLGWLGAP